MSKKKVSIRNGEEFDTSTADHVIGSDVFNVQTEKACVLELFATWCGPCVQLLPHLMKEQIENPHVKFLQLSDEPVERLQKFFAAVGSQLEEIGLPSTPPYCVASSKDLVEEYSNKFEIVGIPHALIICEGVVIWSGHPGNPKFAETIKELNVKYAPIVSVDV